MKVNDVIESYVTDVALRLPRKQRNDVAFELRELLNEELQAKADATGRQVDSQMAIEFLQGFGQPEVVAARYRPAMTIIDPTDGHAFLKLTVIGLAIIWSLGLIKLLQQPVASGWDALGPVSQWWLGTVLPSVWWPGALVLYFGLVSYGRRRWPLVSTWKPVASDRIAGGRGAMVLGIFAILFGLLILIDPRWILDVMFGGRAASVAYDALTYTETFLGRQAPWLFALVALNVPLMISVVIKGRWTSAMRRIEFWVCVLTCAVMMWAVLDGPIFLAESSDGMAKFIMVLIVAATLIGTGIKTYRKVRPKPNR